MGTIQTRVTDMVTKSHQEFRAVTERLGSGSALM